MQIKESHATGLYYGLYYEGLKPFQGGIRRDLIEEVEGSELGMGRQCMEACLGVEAVRE